MSRIATPKTDEELGLDLIYTYRYLRAGMVALLLMLVFAVGYQVVRAGGCTLGSISAYYFTPARAIFIASLCALGALLVVHKARSHEEDVLLDFSGVMAIVVALVPTVPDDGCAGSSTIPPADVAEAVRNNIWSLIVVIIGAMIARALISRRASQPPTRLGSAGRIVAGVCALILLGEFVFFLVARDSFIALSHGIAAVTMVGGIIAVMVYNAIDQPGDDRGRRFRRVYYAIAVALAVALAIAVALHLWLEGFRHFILVAELIVIGLFIAFWVTQTIELWRKEPEQIRDQVERVAPAPAAVGSQEPGARTR